MKRVKGAVPQEKNIEWTMAGTNVSCYLQQKCDVQVKWDTYLKNMAWIF